MWASLFTIKFDKSHKRGKISFIGKTNCRIPILTIGRGDREKLLEKNEMKRRMIKIVHQNCTIKASRRNRDRIDPVRSKFNFFL